MVSRIYKINKAVKQGKQRGVVLVVSLVFLIALTAVAAALMQNSTTDMKMSGASEEKMIADQEVVSAVEEFIFKQVTGGTGNNGFAKPIATFQDGAKDVIAELTNATKHGDIYAASLDIASNEFQLETDCPHSRSASSAQVFTCNILRIQISRKYGRNKTSTVEVNSGIAQHLLK
ncbi:PilX N-terminal domain-containing pilus assembly protein [Colwellia piezophila]|uniref:PilX N-terminal domain-containing pilus assembly protein n=1 Tax=Colwellia piezophila TaxID=211668 RepID=UPI00037F47BF|nr:PilX N-terminal domain-containing pilus assembly protein [Colwellia piezophila]